MDQKKKNALTSVKSIKSFWNILLCKTLKRRHTILPATAHFFKTIRRAIKRCTQTSLHGLKHINTKKRLQLSTPRRSGITTFIKRCAMFEGIYFEFPKLLFLIFFFIACHTLCPMKLPSFYFPHAAKFSKEVLHSSKLLFFFKMARYRYDDSLAYVPRQRGAL